MEKEGWVNVCQIFVLVSCSVLHVGTVHHMAAWGGNDTFNFSTSYQVPYCSSNCGIKQAAHPALPPPTYFQAKPRVAPSEQWTTLTPHARRWPSRFYGSAPNRLSRKRA